MTALAFVCASAGLASASHHHICQTDVRTIMLTPSATAYFTTRSFFVKLKFEAVGCVNDTRVMYLPGLKVSNQTSQVKKMRWYEFSYINCGKYVMKIGSKVVKLNHFSDKCKSQPITVSVESPAVLGRKCSQAGEGKEVEKGNAACRALAGVADTVRRLFTKPAIANVDKVWGLGDASAMLFDTSSLDNDKDDDKSLFDTQGFFYGEQQEPEESNGMSKSQTFKYEDFPPLELPTQPTNNLNEDNFFDNEKFPKRRNYKENAIPIFIGIVAFTVSMCLRLCLCRGKSVVRRVTTVTVIRSRTPNSSDAAQDQQDPPPAYVDVVNENMSPDSPSDDACVEPPPPAYADIAHEVQPPTYSEVEAQTMSSGAASVADQETATQTSSPPPDPGSGSNDKNSEGRGMLSKYISQQKQFAFKVLEEDE